MSGDDGQSVQRADDILDLTVEKPKEFRKTWAKLIDYSRSHLPMVVISVVLIIISTIMQVLGPDYIKQITDGISVSLPFPIGQNLPIDMEYIVGICLTLICLYAVSAISSFGQGWIMATVTQKISKKMRTDVSQKTNRLPFRYYNKKSYGDVMSYLTNDVDTIGQTLNQGVTTLISALAMLIGSLVMMFYINWVMAVTAVASSAVGFLLMFIIMNFSQKQFGAQQDGLGVINGHVEETYSGHLMIKAYNNSGLFKRTFEDINGKLYESAWKSQFYSGLMFPLMGFVGNLGYVMICIVGAILVTDGTISFGVIASFMIYVRLFTHPFSQLAEAAMFLQRTAAAGERVFEFLAERELEDESGKTRRITDAKGDVEFRNIRFGYTPEKTVIHNFSADIKAGQKIAIVGPTGAGKTTLVNLLMRFYEVDEGEILLDGIPTRDVPREDIHDQFSMVLQDTWMFEGTIRENIVYSMQNISDERIIEACKAVGMHQFIMTLPQGYDTPMSDSANLSEGQKQLLTIARAIIKDSPLLILDEATSSVDTRTERIVQKAMDELTVGRTSFVIAHRLSTIKNADRILVIRDGDVVESGSHDHLLSLNGFYAGLYNSQFEGCD